MEDIEANNQVLSYMKTALEGGSGLEPFQSWFERNEHLIKRISQPGVFLRLKNGHDPIPEFRSTLNWNEISYNEALDPFVPRVWGTGSDIKEEWLCGPVPSVRLSPIPILSPSQSNIDGLLFMLEIKQPGDELRYFETPASMWSAKMGSRGIALVRDGEVVYAIETICS